MKRGNLKTNWGVALLVAAFTLGCFQASAHADGLLEKLFGGGDKKEAAPAEPTKSGIRTITTEYGTTEIDEAKNEHRHWDP
ncbi:MAG: hypothetical protein GC159_19725 [Phycisphaera sp.]|nr:hypothetical protein [Phycisphaera sp.]